MNKTDRKLGMDKDISRRDFLNGVSIAVGASLFPGTSFAQDVAVQDLPGYYPPELTGMRGFECHDRIGDSGSLSRR